MYEHPYLSHQVTQFEQEQLERAVERRRRLIAHADQIVPRTPGPVRRMLRRLFRIGGVSRPAATVCETAAVAAR
jgi:hypothetical protein